MRRLSALVLRTVPLQRRGHLGQIPFSDRVYLGRIAATERKLTW